MRINAQSSCVNQNNSIRANNRNCYAVSSCGLQKDTFTPSFTSLKKAVFKGIDFAVVEKFKSPIEKFRSVEDFEAWAEDEYFNLCMRDFGGRTGEVKHKRQNMVCDWDQALSSGRFSSAEKLLIMKGITKGLKPNDETICPIYNREILDKTLEQLKARLEQDKKTPFDFGKMYKKNLIDMYTEHATAGKEEAKWIIIPSRDNDPKNFKENVKKLQTLSSSEMCTKYSGADFHLRNGDMHIYMVNGKPKVALRLNDGLVQEVNGEHNDYRIPSEYVDLTEQYLVENGLVTTEKAEEMLKNSRTRIEPKQPQTPQPSEKSGGFFGFIKKLFG